MAKPATRPVESAAEDTPSAAQILQFEIAARRERFESYAAATRQVVTYELKLPNEAVVAAVGAPDQLRDARDQLQLVVALTGGAVAKFPGGLIARVPMPAVGRFETLAKPLLEAFLVAMRLDEAPCA
ncbi:hypothetical protein [Caulobacter sp. FWC2]|uniref:hypothetical protein n=1 Tax=Caulobacter sp. FWC2 TaxID=69664 RepID=UPI000C15CA4B|nr:hypothetical protein [Caulobacter sp. FWC2]PIB89994.1 hypothetical protein CSW62_25510 [Caulobacter sp. FWC2]